MNNVVMGEVATNLCRAVYSPVDDACSDAVEAWVAHEVHKGVRSAMWATVIDYPGHAAVARVLERIGHV
ncbi:MAG: hypothetical protein LBT97_03150 [Planctomycetota bacterium]|nr:hypothetical protein [Planctomycetota bacterium]